MESDTTTATNGQEVVTEKTVADEKASPATETTENKEVVKTGSENESEAVKSGNDDESIEWNQKPATTTGAPVAESEKPKSDVELAAEVEHWKSEFNRVDSELKALKPYSEDTLVKAWSEYKASEENPTVGGFLKHVGAVTYSEVDHLNGDQLMKAYYTSKAKSKNIPDDEIDEVIAEEMEDYLTAKRLGKLDLEEKARAHFGTGKKKSIEDLEVEFKAKRETIQNEDQQWINTQRENLVDFLNKVVEKGKFNGHTADKKWRDEILKVADGSNAVFNPMFVQYTTPDEKGVTHLFIPSVVDFIDAAYFREENKRRFKQKLDTAKVENIEEKSVEAHNQKLASEIVSTSSTQKELEYFDSFLALRGKRHPKDPRAKKE